VLHTTYPANNARTRRITCERPLAITRRPLAVTRRPVALHTAGACGNASTRWRCIRRALAVTRRPVALHTAGACDNASTRWRCIRRALAITRRPVALHTAGACDNASTRRDAYQGPLILMVPVLGNDSYLCLLRTWVRMNLARGSPPQGDLCPCHDRRRDCSSSCPDGAEMELRTLPRASHGTRSTPSMPSCAMKARAMTPKWRASAWELRWVSFTGCCKGLLLRPAVRRGGFFLAMQ
jgi:hypothetical protein